MKKNSNTQIKTYSINNKINTLNKDIKISVIVPVYNVEKYIKECLDSILNSTLYDIEIICIDDGSTDNTLNILYDIANNDERLKVYSQENKGAGATRNYGLSLARGEYIYFIDADDFIDINALEYLYYEAKKYSLDILMFSGSAFFENEHIKNIYSRYENAYIRKYEYFGIKEGKEIFTEFVNNKEFKVSPVLYIINRNFLEQYKIKFVEGIIYEDNLFTVECLTFAKRVMYINKKFYFRRVREGSVMTSTSIFKCIKSIFRVTRSFKKLAKKNNLKVNKNFYRAYCKNSKKILIGNSINIIKILKLNIKKKNID